MNSHECLWALISTHVHTWALMSTHKYGAMAQWALMSADERPWPHGAMLMTAFELSWVLIAPWPQAHECSWTLMSAHWQSGTLMAALGCLFVPMNANECSWVPMIAHEKRIGEAMNTHELGPWSNEHSWELKNSHGHGTMGPWALIITHEHSLCHSTILMNAHECSWAHMSAYESSWEFMSAELLHWTINKKC